MAREGAVKGAWRPAQEEADASKVAVTLGAMDDLREIAKTAKG